MEQDALGLQHPVSTSTPNDCTLKKAGLNALPNKVNRDCSNSLRHRMVLLCFLHYTWHNSSITSSYSFKYAYHLVRYCSKVTTHLRDHQILSMGATFKQWPRLGATWTPTHTYIHTYTQRQMGTSRKKYDPRVRKNIHARPCAPRRMCTHICISSFGTFCMMALSRQKYKPTCVKSVFYSIYY